MSGYTHKRLTDVEDSAPKFGLSESQESRFAKDDLGSDSLGVTHHHFRPGMRQPFGHRHDEAEEVYVVLGGSGRMALDDEIVEVERLDALRVSPEVTRAFEAGPDGLEVLVFGPRCDGDGDLVNGWWPGDQ
jgi:mannose-6-phosphate isomerase-like protein (cupin superfamily)